MTAATTGRRRTSRMSGDDRERAILDSAERLLAQRPLHEISIDDLASGAGLSRPGFYFYFASKDAVLLALLEQMAAAGRRARDAALELVGDDPRDMWQAGLSAFVDSYRDHRDLIRSVETALATSPAVEALWASLTDLVIDETAAVIEQERLRGAAPAGQDARQLATCLALMTERVLISSLTGTGRGVDEAGVLDALLEVHLRAVYGSVS